MNIIQFNEIIELLHSISDNSTANIIALVSVIISGIAVCTKILKMPLIKRNVKR